MLGSAWLGIFEAAFNVGGWEGGRRLQVMVSEAREWVIAGEIGAADVMGRVGGADPSERDRVQLGLTEERREGGRRRGEERGRRRGEEKGRRRRRGEGGERRGYRD